MSTKPTPTGVPTRRPFSAGNWKKLAEFFKPPTSQFQPTDVGYQLITVGPNQFPDFKVEEFTAPPGLVDDLMTNHLHQIGYVEVRMVGPGYWLGRKGDLTIHVFKIV